MDCTNLRLIATIDTVGRATIERYGRATIDKYERQGWARGSPRAIELALLGEERLSLFQQSLGLVRLPLAPRPHQPAGPSLPSAPATSTTYPLASLLRRAGCGGRASAVRWIPPRSRAVALGEAQLEHLHHSKGRRNQ